MDFKNITIENIVLSKKDLQVQILHGVGDVQFSELPVSYSLASDSVDFLYRVECEIPNLVTLFFVRNFRSYSKSDCSRPFLWAQKKTLRYSSSRMENG